VRPLWAGRTLALLGVVLVALSLRLPVAAMSPILDLVEHDVPLNAVVLAFIGAAPPLAFVVSGLAAPVIARSAGLERTLVAAVVAMAVGHLVRALAAEPVALTGGTVLALVGVGVGNVLLPPIVRRYFPDRVGLITSIYATLMSVSTAVPAGLAVPVADAAGWRVSLGMWTLVAAIAAVPWVLELVARRVPAPAPVAEPGEVPLGTGPVELGAVRLGDAQAAGTEAALEHRPPSRLGIRMLRSPTAWALGLVFGTSSITAYACFAWLPRLLVDQAGVDEASAGGLLALYAFMGFPAGLVVPVVAARFPRSTAPLVLLGAVLLTSGYLGLLLAPGWAPALWVVLAGLGPLLFPLALVLINLRSASPQSTVALSGFVQTVGYLLGAVGPFLVGVLHDASGGWTVPLVLLLSLVVVLFPAAAILARGRLVDSEL